MLHDGNSGSVTRSAARAVAEATGARHLEFDISSLVAGYTAMVEEGIGRPLTWENDDVTLQNIQARVRSPGIWMVANLQGALLLSTSNRSEAAVGYADLDYTLTRQGADNLNAFSTRGGHVLYGDVVLCGGQSSE